MTRGLLAPLSPPEEIALRRVANGSPVIDAHIAARLCGLALIERTVSGFRLTPLGRQRYDALPKALLLTRRLSLHAVNGYVEGLLEKAQLRARMRPPEPGIAAAPPPPAAAPEKPEPSGEPATDDREPAVMDLFDLSHWKMQAEAGADKVRKSLVLQRATDAKLRETSRARIAMSRLLLSGTVPAHLPRLPPLADDRALADDRGLCVGDSLTGRGSSLASARTSEGTA